MSSSSSPPRDPTQASSGSASPDFELVETKSDDDDQEVSSEPQLDLNLVFSPQPLASYDPNLGFLASYDSNLEFSSQPIASYDPTQPYIFPQHISSFKPNVADPSNIYSDIDPETAQFIKSQGPNMLDIMEQKQTFGSYNLPDSSNVYPEVDQETADLMKAQGIDKSELLRQRQALDYFNQTKQSLPQDPAKISTNESLLEGKKSRIKMMKERARRGSEAQTQEDNARDSATVEDTNVGKKTARPPEKPVKFKEPGQPSFLHWEDDGGEGDELLFDTTKNEPEDEYHTLKLFVRLRKEGKISPPEHVVKPRFLRKERELEVKFHVFEKEYGKKLLSKNAFSSKFGYPMYRMSRLLWGDHVIPSDGSGSSIGVDGSFDPDDYECGFDPNAPFYHPDMKCYPYDPYYDPNKDSDPHSSHDSCHDPGVVVDPNGRSELNDSNVSVVEVDPNCSYLDPNEELEPDDPYFDDAVDPVLERVRACFGSLDPIPAPVTRVSAADQKYITKAPQPQAVNVKPRSDREHEAVTTCASEISLGEEGEDSDGADFARAIEISLGKVPEDTKGERIADQIDTVPLKRKIVDTLAEPIDDKQSKRRKLLDSPPNALPAAWRHMQEEEEEEYMLLLPNTDNVEDDDYETLKFLMLCPLRQTFTWEWGYLTPNFEIALTEHINGILPSHHKITTGQCKMKVSSLFKKFIKFRALNGVEDLSEADFSVCREYEIYKMLKTLWVDGPESGESELDPNPAPVVRVSAAGKKLIFNAPQPQAVNVKSERDREFEADMARAIAMSLEDGLGSGVSGSGGDPYSCLNQGVNVSNPVQGAGGNVKDIEMNVNSGILEEPGMNMDAGNVADLGADDNQNQVIVTNVAVDGGQENVDKMEGDGSSEK